MAIGKASDFEIYQEEFYGGMVEVLTQNANAFNAASGNAIRLIPQYHKGDYIKEAFFDSISTLISRRDTTAVTAATDLPLTTSEHVSVKVARKIGPVAQTLDAFRKIAKDASEASFILGQQTGKAVAVDYINTAVKALMASAGGTAAMTSDYTTAGSGPATISHARLNGALELMGDASANVVAFVMRGVSFHRLIGQAISDNIFQVGGATIIGGSVATFNRPVIVLDAPDLFTATPAPDEARVLCLVRDACTVQESEAREIVSDTVTGLENIVLRIQGEYAFTVGVKGFQWDVANGGANPDDTALALATNWDLVGLAATDIKAGPGVVLKFDEA